MKRRYKILYRAPWDHKLRFEGLVLEFASDKEADEYCDRESSLDEDHGEFDWEVE